MNIYEISNKYLQLLEIEDELDEQAFRDTLESIDDELETKAENYAKVMKQFELEQESIKKEEERLYKRRKALASKSENLKQMLFDNMKLVNKTKFKTSLFSFNISKNPASVKFTNEDLIPAEFKEEVVTIKIDKNKIKEAIKNGEVIDGIELTQSESLKIK